MKNTILITLLFAALSRSVAESAMLLTYDFAASLSPTSSSANVSGSAFVGSGATGIAVANTGGSATATNVNQGSVTGSASTSTGTFTASSGVMTFTMGSTTTSLAQATATSGGLPTSNKYMTFSAAADPGFLLDLNTLSFDFAKGNTGSDRGAALFYSIDGFTTSSSLLGSYTVLNATANLNYTRVTYNLSAIPNASTVTFRFNAIQSGTSLNSRYDNLVLDGTVAVPEPTLSAMLLGGLGLIGLRRKARQSWARL